ncbi:MAG: hypothetical protein FWE98_06235 [Oscillospiraceae bacterium]|nr:hypothetical protein [Oscillospiraceae bacterium]
MKHAKKPLALLLALVIALGLGVSAMAEEELDVPYIITQPQNQNLPYGAAITLSVEVYLPEGWTAEYQWYIRHRWFQEYGFTNDKYILDGATEPTLLLSPGDPWYTIYWFYEEGIDYTFFCEVTFAGAYQTLNSDNARVIVAEKTADDLPYVITSPKDLTIRSGRSFILSVEVYVPKGWTVEYEWFVGNQEPQFGPGTVTTKPSILVARGDPGYFFRWGRASYYCNITAYDKDGDPFQLPQQYASVTAKSLADGFLSTLWNSRIMIRLSNSGVVGVLFVAFIFAITILPTLLIGELFGWIRSWLPPVS